jgi:amino acid permease
MLKPLLFSLLFLLLQEVERVSQPFSSVHSHSLRGHTVFTFLSYSIAIAGLITWFGIGITYIRFYQGLKAHGIDRTKLPYAAKLQPYLAIYATCFTSLICIVRGS